MIRVVLPQHLRTLARVDSEVTLEVEGAITQRAILDALEARYPVLCGTIRDHVTHERRPFLRFFACEEDWSHELPDAPLPSKVASGAEPFLVDRRDGRRRRARQRPTNQAVSVLSRGLGVGRPSRAHNTRSGKSQNLITD